MNRREFLLQAGAALVALGGPGRSSATGDEALAQERPSGGGAALVTLFLGGDVMTGRGIDQVLSRPGDPILNEPHVKDARRYVDLAEKVNGPIPRPVDDAYIWGDALEELALAAPDVRIVNLETAVTTSNDFSKRKGIHYRMNPANVPCLAAGRIDCCALANNHVLDWGAAGLAETLETLRRAGIGTAGAGPSHREAGSPAVIEVSGKGRPRILVRVGGQRDPSRLGGQSDCPGVNFLPDFSRTTRRIAAMILNAKRKGDIVVASSHWGDNWGFPVRREHVMFARGLVDAAGVDVVHGHSSHHPKGIEVYRGKPILYGCGDLINDYEGIGGRAEFRPDLGLLYFVSLDAASGTLSRLRMVPVRRRRFRLDRGSEEEARWLTETLNRQSAPFGTRVERDREGRLSLRLI
jgi:poly-gamma-glutamate synthesis protein (capsule biosynthesis protein)